MKKSLLILMFISIFLGVTAFVSYQAIQKPEKAVPEFSPPIMSEKLGLSEEQQAKIKELNFQTQKEIISLRAKIKIAELELRKLIDEKNPDEGAIKKKIEEIANLKSQVRWVEIKHQLQVKNILTEEQLQTLKKLKRKRMMRHLRGRFHRFHRMFDRDRPIPEPGPEIEDQQGALL